MGELAVGVERPVDRGTEQVRLAAEEVRDQCRVDAGLGRDRPHRRALKASFSEQTPPGNEDGFARLSSFCAGTASVRGVCVERCGRSVVMGSKLDK
jgi:hypothetical protein